MGVKTRYLQLSDVIMMEYILKGESELSDASAGVDNLIYTKYKNGHYGIFNNANSECAYGSKRSNKDIVTINNINHLAVPTDKRDTEWYTFLDPDYQYVDEENLYELYPSDVKVSQYVEYCTNPLGKDNPFEYINITGSGLEFDTLRLYFVNGYDFGNIYGILSRVSVNRTDGGILDLCNLFLNKSSLYKLIQFLSSPIIFGNNIYDRYIDINLASLYQLVHTDIEIENADYENLNDILKVGNNSTITLNFAYVDSESYQTKTIDYDVTELIKNGDVTTDKTNCFFTRSSSIKGNIPAENISSDNLGLYIAESPEYPYFEFYATWKDMPLSFDIVQKFNREIKLYDPKTITHKELDDYVVSDSYKAEVNLKKWIVMHEINATLYNGETVVREETYNMSQVFVVNYNEITKFYYRPVIFDESLANTVDNIKLDYTMRLINVEDRVQFVKKGTLATTNINKFYAKGNKIDASDITPYKIYNKIVESKQEYSGGGIVSPKTKYVKVFYNSTDIVLDSDGNNVTDYTLKLSNVPKTYKFNFKTLKSNGKYDYMDLTDGYYKLYTKDAAGNDIVIEPSYSTNMNLLLGEIEFNISSDVLNRLAQVDEYDRKMSIVAVSDNNIMSSMYDFYYDF